MRIENEDQNVTLETLEMLCQTFHIDVAQLFPPVDSIRVYQPPARGGADMPMIHEPESSQSSASAPVTGKIKHKPNKKLK